MNALPKGWMAPEELRRARERTGLTQRDLANRIGVSQQTVCGWELGRVNPKERIYQRLVEELEALLSSIKGITNEDVLRNMPTEELVFVINCPKECCSIPRKDRDCYQCKLDWLRAERKYS